MKVIVLGAGVIGVTAAYVLASRGHTVEVVDRQPTPGAETSFANGGQLSYTYAEPWANPHLLKKLPGWLLRSNSPVYLRPRADLEMVRWGLKFLRNCTPARAEAHCIALTRLGLYSRLKTAQMMAETNVAFDYAERGILHVFPDEAAWRDMQRQMEFQTKYGCEHRVLSVREALTLEPSLADAEHPIVGGVLAPQDAQGDAHSFTIALAAECAQKFGVAFHYGTHIEALETNGSRITGLRTDKTTLHADAYLLALGSYSPLLAKPLGLRLPIYPMKGYSITLPFNANSPQISVMDAAHKIVATKLGNRLRIAGTAEFAGYNTRVIPQRIAPIAAAARSLLPKAAWDQPQESWACLRASTPSGVPILGRSPIDNLYLNTGHGTLGWTQAAGSAYLVADLIDNRPPEIATGGLTLEDA